MRRFRWAIVGGLMLAVVSIVVGGAGASRGDDQLQRINHVVVIYEENHSFDNLYGGWEGVNGLANADAAHTTQVDQHGTAYGCLRVDDANLALVSVGSCTAPSGFPNTWFTIDNFIHPTDTTCPAPLNAFASQTGFLNGTGLPGGCTRDLVHRFYEEQYQLNGGMQNRYATGSDAEGLTMGVYDTKALPIYTYLHSGDHPHYAILDDFFQAAFGGSFLNHQWLIASRTPDYPNMPASQRSVLDTNGMTLTANHQDRWLLYASPQPGTIVDGAGTIACAAGVTVACGDFAVNTTEPQWEPTNAFSPTLPVQTNPTIGDRLDAAHVDWAWYAGGWSNANGNINGPGWTNGTGTPCTDPAHASFSHNGFCPDNVFQQHHQPFNYFAEFNPATATGLANRTAHLKDEASFFDTLSQSGDECSLKPVSFVKPLGEENEHPGYASEPGGSDHLVKLLKAIQGSACAKDTMVIVTYDEFGGQWDHVSPPGQGQAPCQYRTWVEGGVPGCTHDVWGPGTRVPALVISPFIRGNFAVDHTQYDTTSILATIEHRWGLDPLSSRDEAVNDLSNVFAAKQYEAATP
jgi:acid phosphatase